MTITKETLISDILTACPESAPLFQSIGMHCFHCALATGETLEEACRVHGVDADEFLGRLNALAEKA